MSNLKPFQLAVVIICGFLGVIGVLIFAFAGGKPDPTKDSGPLVVIWGTVPEDPLNAAIKEINDLGGSTYIHAVYVQKEEASFEQELLEGIASGKGPDAILVPAEDILRQRQKISLIPLENINERSFKDAFIEQGELFVTPQGYMALPFSVDPMVLYWNRDIFTSRNEPNPPTYWDSLLSLVPKLTDASEDFTINKSAIGLGDYRNVNHAREIISALLFQSGVPITDLSFNDREDQILSLSITTPNDLLLTPLHAVLNFYTQFANPLVDEYTWNRSLPNSFDLFARGDLAMYIGFGSEKDAIRAKNPNLNFDMAFFPQSRSSAVPRTYGKMQGLAILFSSVNKLGAYNAITNLTSKDFLDVYTQSSGLPPVRRDLLATPPNDAYSSILYKSALYAQSWIDPNTVETENIFQSMIESVLAGRDTLSDVVTTAADRLRISIEALNEKNNEQ